MKAKQVEREMSKIRKAKTQNHDEIQGARGEVAKLPLRFERVVVARKP
jgi:hypothetical protein